MSETIEQISVMQKDAAKAIGVNPRTFRRWEKKGLIKGHSPVDGVRLYLLSDLRRLASGEKGVGNGNA